MNCRDEKQIARLDEDVTKLEAENEKLYRQRSFLISVVRSGEQLSDKEIKELEE